MKLPYKIVKTADYEALIEENKEYKDIEKEQMKMSLANIEADLVLRYQKTFWKRIAVVYLVLIAIYLLIKVNPFKKKSTFRFAGGTKLL